MYFWLLVIGQIGHAFGGSAVYTLGLPYMDTQIKTRDTPLYIGTFSPPKMVCLKHVKIALFSGIMQGFAALGPGLGFILGGVFLKFYVDFYHQEVSPQTCTASIFSTYV